MLAARTWVSKRSRTVSSMSLPTSRAPPGDTATMPGRISPPSRTTCSTSSEGEGRIIRAPHRRIQRRDHDRTQLQRLRRAQRREAECGEQAFGQVDRDAVAASGATLLEQADDHGGKVSGSSTSASLPAHRASSSSLPVQADHAGFVDVSGLVDCDAAGLLCGLDRRHGTLRETAGGHSLLMPRRLAINAEMAESLIARDQRRGAATSNPSRFSNRLCTAATTRLPTGFHEGQEERLQLPPQPVTSRRAS